MLVGFRIISIYSTSLDSQVCPETDEKTWIRFDLYFMNICIFFSSIWSELKTKSISWNDYLIQSIHIFIRLARPNFIY